jgi:hypothetical protein
MVGNVLKTAVVLHDASWAPESADESDKSILPVYGNISCGCFKLIDEYVEGYL